MENRLKQAENSARRLALFKQGRTGECTGKVAMLANAGIASGASAVLLSNSTRVPYSIDIRSTHPKESGYLSVGLINSWRLDMGPCDMQSFIIHRQYFQTSKAYTSD
ncbi:hypothetical protein CHS0354_012538 [Potamilus streckersoni]|uniref:Uncharacterized protein n=1 Tax=Potamilus streckersoni TaxID=2493646 RepID=A0AAE0SWQ9_9BIVA|nr:hypothetical protein CHS0354_012538 [Potamilus streckersoni]